MKAIYRFPSKYRLQCIRVLKATAAGTAVCMALVGCAVASSDYNPDSLPKEQVERIAQICQNVMGLNPSEPPVSGVHPGTPHLDPNVSHYQGCVASLSDSAQRRSDASAARQARLNCRAQGLEPDSPELALCVLRRAESYSASAASTGGTSKASPEIDTPETASTSNAAPHETLHRVPPGAGTHSAAAASTGAASHADEEIDIRPAGSFFYAAPHETLHREQTACALLGLDPFGDEFGRCVKNLNTTFFAIDNPLD